MCGYSMRSSIPTYRKDAVQFAGVQLLFILPIILEAAERTNMAAKAAGEYPIALLFSP